MEWIGAFAIYIAVVVALAVTWP
ncbi:hypothetical protein SEA_HERBERTWM_65 [Mycobacterium phage Herbertwm]|nr:hypothetical protein SEA_HERBERTWM_65 [Mycobacterium phage Herbertwm]